MEILKNIKKNTIILLIVTLIILFILLKDDFTSIINAFKNINPTYIFLAVIFYLLSILIKGYVNYKIVDDKKKVTLNEAIKHNFITQFFNGITPFSSGGQPMEIYMLIEHGISIPKATNYTIQSFIFYQIALVICGVLAVIYNFIFRIFPKVKLLEKLVLLGFSINIIVIIVLLVISYSKKATKKMSQIVIKTSKSLKIKVNETDIEKKFEDYYQGFQILKKRKKLSIVGVLLNIISLLCIYITPLFILYSVNNYYSMNVFDTLTSSAYVYLIGAFVPIPGASGGIEYGFTQFFGNFIQTGLLSAILIIWRFITYYLGIIIGALLFSLEKKVRE